MTPTHALRRRILPWAWTVLFAAAASIACPSRGAEPASPFDAAAATGDDAFWWPAPLFDSVPDILADADFDSPDRSDDEPGTVAIGPAHVVVGYDAGRVDVPPPAPPALVPDTAPWSELEDLRQRLAGLEARLGQRDAADRRTADAARNRFTARPFGRLHLDVANFDQDDANKAVVGDAPNGVDIRRARLGVEGEGFDVLFYRFDVDFVATDASTGEGPTIFDAYLDVQEVPGIGNLRIGHFREPIGLDRLDSSHDLPLMERAAVTTALVPFRNLGLMAFDWNADETCTWAYGVFDESTNEFGADVADSRGVTGTARATWLPYFEERDGGPHLVHLGTALSARHLGSATMRRFASTPEIQVREGNASRTPNFVDTGNLRLSDYLVWGTEAAYDRGPWYVQAESVLVSGDMADGTSFGFAGGYLETGYFWTGETRVYDRRAGIHRSIDPCEPVFGGRDGNGPRWGRGAWESVLRVSYVDLADGAIDGGRMTDVTVGLNWYLMRRSRVMFNYVRSLLDRDDVDSAANIFGVRFQYAF